MSGPVVCQTGSGRLGSYSGDVARVLVTGLSGTGKTKVLEELHPRGHRTLDTDYDGWVRADGGWDVPRMAELLDRHADIFIAGTVDNQGHFYPQFDHVVLLSAPLDVLLHRVGVRSGNPYGKSAADRAEIEHYLATVEPLLRRGASVELDARLPVSVLADRLAELP